MFCIKVYHLGEWFLSGLFRILGTFEGVLLFTRVLEMRISNDIQPPPVEIETIYMAQAKL